MLLGSTLDVWNTRVKGTMRFSSEPLGKLELKDGTAIVKLPIEHGPVAKTVSELAFLAEPLRCCGDRGYWFEIRLEERMSGYLSTLGIGFTLTDPATLKEAPLPARAYQIPQTYVAGYVRSAFWAGKRIPIEDLFKDVKPFTMCTVGALATLSGGLQVYVNRRLVFNFDPTDRCVAPMNTEEPLYGVVDASGGLKRAVLLPKSLPPSSCEAEP